jgi:4-carboxymuconolactone decarboxylase
MQEVAPALADYSANVLFGDVWERPELSKRDRSLITVAVLTALYRTDQLRGHIGRALDNGVTKEEISEVITHIAFYGGWPTAANAVQVAKQVFDQRK